MVNNPNIVSDENLAPDGGVLSDFMQEEHGVGLKADPPAVPMPNPGAAAPGLAAASTPTVLDESGDAMPAQSDQLPKASPTRPRLGLL